MPATTVEEALDRFLQAALAGDIPTLLGTLLPEALAAIQGLGLQSAGPIQGWQVVARNRDGGLESVDVRFQADEPLALRFGWREVGGGWKLAKAARLSGSETPPPGPMEALLGPPDLTWLDARTEWGVRPTIGAGGLTLEAVNIGSYGVVPETAATATQKPRGAEPGRGVPAMGFSILDRAEVWSPAAAVLYEEAIQRRWRPSTDIPWDTIAPLPDLIEGAVCQVCTSLSERACVANDAPASWEHHIAYDFHEVKLYLASQIFDAARHVEVFRKRALVNGGGLGVQTPGQLIRLVLEAQSFSEMSLHLHITLATQTQMLLRALASVAHNPAEAAICAFAVQDVTRWLAFGMTHLRELLTAHPERRAEFHTYLDKSEGLLATDMERDAPLNEAMALLLGGAVENARAGAARWRAYHAQALRGYLARLAWAGLDGRAARLDPRLAAVLSDDSAPPPAPSRRRQPQEN
jgi:hypothetical protein